MHRRLLVALAALAALSVVPATANAAELIGRNASQIKLSISTDGKKALVTYVAQGAKHSTLAWGAINSIAPTTAREQVALRLDFSGGYKSFHIKKGQWRGGCNTYDGPTLHWLVTACKASDGSYWALQTWQRALPNYGVAPNAFQKQYELWLSHWSGPLPEFDVDLGWAYGRFNTIWGRFSYLGKPIYGFGTGVNGRPTDSYGRVAYVDTLNSAYGRGWMRENSFVTHKGYGTFCYGFYPHGRHPSGMSTRYRITIQGPGVMPDMYWEGSPQRTYDKTYDQEQKAKLQALGDPDCG